MLLSTRVKLGGMLSDLEAEVPVPKLGKVDARAAFLSAAGGRLTAAEESSEELSKMLQWLDGHPLSLMLVAKQTGSISLGRLWKRLQDQEVDAMVDPEVPDEALKGAEDGGLRQARLASCINLSYVPLRDANSAAAELFAWLGHLPAGLPGVLIPHIFGETGEDLRDKLLRSYLAEEHDSERRLVMPVPVQSYAQKQVALLPPERRRELLTATFSALGAWMEALYEQIGTSRAREAMDRGAREEANLRALLRVAEQLFPNGEKGEGPNAMASAMVRALAPFAQIMIHAGRHAVAIEIIRAAKSRIEQLGSGVAIAMMQKALGDLFVRTDRLNEAESAYRIALTLFRDIDARLGQANTVDGMGSLALAGGDASQAFVYFLDSLRLRREIEDALGTAGAHGYLARAALAGGKPLRASALGGRAVHLLAKIEDRFGQLVALQDLAQAFAALGREEPATIALLLASSHAAAIGDPRAEKLTQATGTSAPAPEDVPALQSVLNTALAECEAELEALGEDLYSPLTP